MEEFSMKTVIADALENIKEYWGYFGVSGWDYMIRDMKMSSDVPFVVEIWMGINSGVRVFRVSDVNEEMCYRRILKELCTHGINKVYENTIQLYRSCPGYDLRNVASNPLTPNECIKTKDQDKEKAIRDILDDFKRFSLSEDEAVERIKEVCYK